MKIQLVIFCVILKTEIIVKLMVEDFRFETLDWISQTIMEEERVSGEPM